MVKEAGSMFCTNLNSQVNLSLDPSVAHCSSLTLKQQPNLERNGHAAPWQKGNMKATFLETGDVLQQLGIQ